MYGHGGFELINDWIILKLDSPLEFNDDVRPACLPSPNWTPETDPNNYCFASGWGLLSHEGYPPWVLQWVELPVVSNEVCKVTNGPWVTDSVICAGRPSGGKSICNGDSGGPLVCLNGTNFILTGVTSYMYDCASPGNYNGFARVTTALDWIKSSMVCTMQPALISGNICLFNYFINDRIRNS